MFHFVRDHASSGLRYLLLVVGAATLLSIWACNKKEQASTAQASPRTFASPDDAGKALFEAAKSGNHEAILAIFGPGSKDLIYTGDAAEDKDSVDGFVRAYEVMNRWRKLGDGSKLLLVGADNQAFPIPLKNAAGQWYFDTAAGKEEILARRIGRDEIVAFDVSEALADAQEQYSAQKHGGVRQYAQKFISDAGQQNGCTGNPRKVLLAAPLGRWSHSPPKRDLPSSPMPHSPSMATTSAGWIVRAPMPEAARNRMLSMERRPVDSPMPRTRQIRHTGVKTFIINQDRMVYEKNLGNDTADVARSLTEFNPDNTWTALQ